MLIRVSLWAQLSVTFLDSSGHSFCGWSLVKGSSSRDEYVDVYVTQMSLYTIDDEIFCWVVPTMLKGAELSWLVRLHLFSIGNFEILVSKFGTHSLLVDHITWLPSSCQHQARERRVIKDLHGGLANSHCKPKISIPKWLCITDSLCKKPTTNLDKLKRITMKFIQFEELREFCDEVKVESNSDKTRGKTR